MHARDEMHFAYILHSTPYRETSLLIDVLTPDHGRLSLVARGARGAKKRGQQPLQPFVPLQISWFGRHDLLTLSRAEPAAAAHFLMGNKIYVGLYVNELIVRLTTRFDPHAEIYHNYAALIALLASEEEYLVSLRLFEKRLLAALGYALPLTAEGQSGDAIDPDQYYLFDPERGPILLPTRSKDSILGAHFIALAAENLVNQEALQAAKFLLNIAIQRVVGSKPLQSRIVFSRS